MERRLTKRKKTVSGPKKKTTHRRRRRISGSGDLQGSIMKIGAMGLGAVGGRELNTILVKVFPSIGSSPMLSAALQIAGGIFIPKFVKGAFMENFGAGMATNGVMVGVVSTGIISGPADMMAYSVNGVSNLRVINGTSNLPVVNGPQSRISNQVVPAPKPQRVLNVANKHYV